MRNSLQHTEEKEALSTQESGLMKWYSCGPTVYDDAHLGHARAYVTFDIMRRLISNYTSTAVDYALGVTDIDDKIIRRAQESNQSPRDLAQRFEARFFEDMRALNVLAPTRVLRVTEHIDSIQGMVHHLQQSGAAYASPRGNVYFSVKSRGDRYGLLDASRGVHETAATAAANVPEERDDEGHMAEKRDRRDFALWKGATVGEDSEVSWESPWGNGRPGWHVECSAMAQCTLGDTLDVHTGGIDLRFPHHTNELATAEARLALSGDKRWAHTWLHAGHLHLHGRKMSKSLKNFVPVRHYLQQGGSADSFRLFCLSNRYSNGVEFSDDRAEEADGNLKRIRTFVNRDLLARVLRQGAPMAAGCPVAAAIRQCVHDTHVEVEEGIADDFNTPRVLRAINTVIAAGNQALRDDEVVSGDAGVAYEQARRLVLAVLHGVGMSLDVGSAVQHANASDEDMRADVATEVLVKFRANIRAAARQKDMSQIFKLCDDVRSEAKNTLNVQMTDGKDGEWSWTKEDM